MYQSVSGSGPRVTTAAPLMRDDQQGKGNQSVPNSRAGRSRPGRGQSDETDSGVATGFEEAVALTRRLLRQHRATMTTGTHRGPCGDGAGDPDGPGPGGRCDAAR